jgi:hypothetical protein
MHVSSRIAGIPVVTAGLLASFLLIGAAGCGEPTKVEHAEVPASTQLSSAVPQSGPNPLPVGVAADVDNVSYLLAAAAERSPGLTVLYPDEFPKHFWINNFDSTDDYLLWHVDAAGGGEFRVTALMSASGGETFRLEQPEGGTATEFAKDIDGWARQEAGVIRLPAGTSTLRLVRTSEYGDVDVKSLELVRTEDVPAREARIADFRAGTSGFSKAGYGLMFQYGPWGYPQSGPRKSLDEQTDDFDVPAFVEMVKETGASWVIWSLTWWEYRMNAPIAAVDRLIGNGDRTSSRDLVGEIMTALDAAGIGFFLYYHRGHEDDPWFAADVFPPTEFTLRGTGDRSALFDSWIEIVTEIGERYGEKLDGWFFDDGVVYYPAPFESLGQAARAGNPKRLISWNAWVSASVTEFQDVMFGEGHHGEVIAGSAGIDGNGILTGGPSAGLLEHGMFMTADDWGIHEENQAFEVRVTPEQARAWIDAGAERNVPLSFTLLMWQDGTVPPASLDLFVQ